MGIIFSSFIQMGDFKIDSGSQLTEFCHRFQTRPYTEFVIKVLEMGLDGIHSNKLFISHLFIGESLVNILKCLKFLLSEWRKQHLIKTL